MSEDYTQRIVKQLAGTGGGKPPLSPEDEHLRGVWLDREAQQNAGAMAQPEPMSYQPSQAPGASPMGAFGQSLDYFNKTARGPFQPVSSMSPSMRSQHMYAVGNLIGLGENPLADAMLMRGQK